MIKDNFKKIYQYVDEINKNGLDTVTESVPTN